MTGETSRPLTDYYKVQGFYHTVFRNIGLAISISLAVMTLNRYWRNKHNYISILTYLIATGFLFISVYINILFINEVDVHLNELQDGEARMFKRWVNVSKLIIGAQCVISVVYGYIGSSIFKELKVAASSAKRRRS